MMKRFFTAVLFFLAIGTMASAQMVEPAKWSFKVVQKDTKEAELIATVKLDKDWHIYSQKELADGPLPTVFTWPKMGVYSLIGATKEPGNGHADKMWEEQGVQNVICFEGTVSFKQKIKITTDKKFEIKGNISYMVCKESCIPGEINFSFVVNDGIAATDGNNDVKIEDAAIKPDTNNIAKVENATVKAGCTNPISFRFIPVKYSKQDYELTIRTTIDTGWAMAGKNDSRNPVKFLFEFPEGVVLKGDVKYPESNGKDKIFDKSYRYVVDFKQRFFVENGDSLLMQGIVVKPYFAASNGSNVFQQTTENSKNVDMSKASLQTDPNIPDSYLLIFLEAFLAGFIALIMPCVFPMIPMTVSFFLKRSKTRKEGISNAITYGLSIIVIYVALGSIISAVFGSDALNALATNIWFNLFFFAMLVVFALSFLGAFELNLPTSWVNAADKRADKGGKIGIFFMAFTLALVTFSCTGPIIGSLLVVASKEGILGPMIGMFGFSLAIALPFTLFAVFPSWLNSMPSSGGWLNTVKVSLGFLELAFSLKFLSNADLVVQAHLLERETFIALWIAIFGLWGLYLLGKFKLAHDSEVNYLSTGRITTAILVFSFTIYMLPGLFGAPLKWIAGFPPGPNYSEIPYGIHGEAPKMKSKKHKGPPPHTVDGPHHIPAFHNYDEALAYAKEINKPLLIDFTGYACVNCRQMEELVWGEPEVLPMMKDSLVLASLYVDDKTTLPEHEQYTSKFDGKEIRTYGQKWSDLQKSTYGSNSQPQYFMLDNFETVLNGTANYQDNGSAKKFGKWLVQGIEQYAAFSAADELKPCLIQVQ
jgi:thiol:disulfide interchange protein/DsbC/DsbD-like thiol-disulfide interchange protein